MASDIYVRAPWSPGYVIKYIDTGQTHQGAPVYAIATGNADSVVSAGLLGVYDSDSYRIAEIERHLHSYEHWFGDGGQTLTPFTLDSANDDWGAWVQLLAADDTPFVTGSVYYDMHRIVVTATERNTPYRVQIAFGATGDAALAAGDYTEFIVAPASNLVDAGPVDILGRRHATGTLAWGRCWVGADTGTINLFIGIHEYEG